VGLRNKEGLQKMRDEMMKADRKALRVLKNAAFLFGLPLAAIFYPFALASCMYFVGFRNLPR
jgi:hypothetical protein